MKKHFLFVVAICFSLVAFSQRINIKGTVEDKESGEKLMFANCILQYKTDTVGIYKGETTDENGSFTFKNIKKRDLILKISYVGYKTYRKEISSSQFVKGTDIDLDKILMEQLDELEVVQIVAQRKRIEIDDDKMTVNVDDNMAGMVSTAFDLLRLVPGVMLDNEENITLNGQSGVQFQYNGRELKMDWDGVKDMLKSMTPEMIDSYEVLKNPGVRYDAEGTAGIINIKMKKAQNYGINGSLNANIGFKDKYNYSFREGARLNFVNDKWIISGGYSHNDNFDGQKDRADSSYRWQWKNNDTSFFRNYSGERKNRSHNNSFDFSASYSLDTTSALSFDARYSWNNRPYTQTTSQTLISHNDNYFQTDSLYRTSSGSKNDGNRANLALGYVKKLSVDDTKISADLDYSTNNSISSSLSEISYYDGSVWDEEFLNRRQGYKRENDNTSHNVAFRIDYYKPLGKGNRFEAGLKTNYNYSDRDYTSLLHNGTAYVNNPNESNRFKYTENINSLYASVTNKFFDRKLSVRLGIRAEQTNTKGKQVTTDTVNELHYFNIFPNLRLGWKFSDSKEIGINYSYRLSRPWSNQLNPFIQKNNDYSYSTGNPALEPSYTHSVSMSYSSDFVFFPTVSYSHSYNNRETLTVPMDDSYGITYNELALISYPINLGTSDRVSAHLSYSKSIGMSWYFSLNGGLNYSSVKSTNNNVNVSNDGFTYNFSANAFGTLPYDIRLSFFFMYYSANINAFGRSTGWQNFDISLGRDFFDKKLNVSLSCNFRNFSIWHNESEYLNYKQESWGKREMPYWRFSVRYKFGKFYQNKQVKKQKTENFDSDDNSQPSGEQTTEQYDG
ncbi:MAG: TonB-dependent receptor [Bacteroidales bacterium]|nr:TonB-dependent receptor [Bacteroidales bacterium]